MHSKILQLVTHIYVQTESHNDNYDYIVILLNYIIENKQLSKNNNKQTDAAASLVCAPSLRIRHTYAVDSIFHSLCQK